MDAVPTDQAALNESPGRKLMNTYLRELAMLPGITLISWSLEQPDAVGLEFEDPQLLRLAQGVLRDTINGASWIYKLEDGASDLPAPPSNGRAPWFERPQNLAAVVQGFAGVEDVQLDKLRREAVMITHDQAVVDHLRPLIRDTFGEFSVFLAPRRAA
jgi:hypothetical protein